MPHRLPVHLHIPGRWHGRDARVTGHPTIPDPVSLCFGYESETARFAFANRAALAWWKVVHVKSHLEPMQMFLGGRPLLVRRATVEEIVPLRHRILRAGLPIEEALFTGDKDATTRHAAAFFGAEAVGCATFVLNSWEGEPAWQLRGMATDADCQGQGVGEAVLRLAIGLAFDSAPVRLLWCNARIGALRFYRRQGWEIRSEEFDIPTAGLHRKMTKRG